MHYFGVNKCSKIIILSLITLLCFTSYPLLPAHALTKAMVCCSSTHSMALKEDGTVWTWGNNIYGQLGNGALGNRNRPVEVKGLANIKSIACIDCASYALGEDNTLYGWGENAYGCNPLLRLRLGFESEYDTDHPVKLHPSIAINVIRACVYQLCAYQPYSTPIAAHHVGGIYWETIALSSDNGSFKKVFPGINQGWFGVDDKDQVWYKKDNYSPVSKIHNLKDVISIDGLSSFTALKTDGTVWTWGPNSAGLFENGIYNDPQIPKQVAGIDHVIQIDAKGSEHLALKDNGDVYHWGSFSLLENKDGDHDSNDFSVLTRRQKVGVFPPAFEEPQPRVNLNPTIIPELSNIKYIAGSGLHWLAIKDDGTVWSWGYNDFGELGDGSNYNRANPLMIKDFNVLASPVKDQKTDTTQKKSM